MRCCLQQLPTAVVYALAVCLVVLAAGPVAASDAEDGQWTQAAHDHANTRYSPLAEITSSNVGRLKEAFSFDTGVDRGQEAAPLVAGDTMVVVTPYPNIVYALDLAQPGAHVKWQFEPKPLAESQGIACCDVVNRGAAIANGRVFFNTLDNQTIALDLATGRELWRARLGEIRKGETMSMAPLVVRD